MSSQVTYTGKIGAGNAVTAKVFPDVRTLTLDFDTRTMELTYYEPAQSQPQNAILDMSGGTVTLTDSVTANQHTIVVSVA